MYRADLVTAHSAIVTRRAFMRWVDARLPPGNTELVPTITDTLTMLLHAHSSSCVSLVSVGECALVCDRVGATPLACSVVWNILNLSGTSSTKRRQVRGSRLWQTNHRYTYIYGLTWLRRVVVSVGNSNISFQSCSRSICVGVGRGAKPLWEQWKWQRTIRVR